MTGSTIFCGCSYVQGIGLELEKNDSNLWVNILHKSIGPLSATRLINAGVGGAANEDIFLSALHNLLDHQDCCYLFVAWTSLKRLHVNPSVELYATNLYLERSSIPDVGVNPNITIPGKYVENIRDRFFDLTHTHYDLLKILQYTNVIGQLANKLDVKVFFINSLLPVDTNYFTHILTETRVPTDTTFYTQKLLNLDTRDDEEYLILYDKIHSEYKKTGGLDHNWLNIDRGFRRYFYADAGNDNLHPGIKSNKNFAHFLIEKFNSRQQLDNYAT
jgi:hypothetical protein